MTEEFEFDAVTAREVSERLRVIREQQEAVNLICLTVARMKGAQGDERVYLSPTGGGVVVEWRDVVAEESVPHSPPVAPDSRVVKEGFGKK